MTDNQILAAALLWLRNHYEVGDQKLKPVVLARIDKVLESHPVSVSSMSNFRNMFPIKASVQGDGAPITGSRS